MRARKSPPKIERCARAGRARASAVRPATRISALASEPVATPMTPRTKYRVTTPMAMTMSATRSQPRTNSSTGSEKKYKDHDREDDHPARGSRYAVAAPAETREVDVRPVDVSPVPAPVTATAALAHPSSG